MRVVATPDEPIGDGHARENIVLTLVTGRTHLPIEKGTFHRKSFPLASGAGRGAAVEGLGGLLMELRERIA